MSRKKSYELNTHFTLSHKPVEGGWARGRGLAPPPHFQGDKVYQIGLHSPNFSKSPYQLISIHQDYSSPLKRKSKDKIEAILAANE